METPNCCPSLVGYTPDEAEAIAAKHGLRTRWIDCETPKWLSPRHEARVGRQILGDDDVLELLRVLIPSLPADSGEDAGDGQCEDA